MTIIPFDSIKTEINKTDETGNLTRYDNLRRDENIGELSASDQRFIHNFESGIEIIRDLIATHPNISDYYETRQCMTMTHLTPEDMDRGIISLGTVIGLPRSFADIDFNALKSVGYIPAFTKIVSNDPETIVCFTDGTHERVVCEPDETFDAEKGVLIAILKKAIGGKNLQHLYKLMRDAGIRSNDSVHRCHCCHDSETAYASTDDWEEIPVEWLDKSESNAS